jgi:hypothetical protein
MSQHDDVKRLAQLLAKDIRSSKATERTWEARLYLEDNLDAAMTVLDLLQKESNRKKPDEVRVQAYHYMFALALELTRYQVERGYDWAEALVESMRERILRLARDGAISGSVLMSLLKGFRDAKLDPGDTLTSLAGDLVAEESQKAADFGPGELDQVLRTFAEELGGDTFELYGQLADFAQSLPPEFRTFMVEQTAASTFEALRDCAALSLLDPSPEVRKHTCRMIERVASPELVSPVALRRMIAVRNWLREDERPVVDSAIKRVRHKGVACASWPSRTILEILATVVDGAGAQSVFAVAKDGRKHVLCGLLVKQGTGVADAWCLRDQSESEVAEILDGLSSQVLALPVESDFVDHLVRHHLAFGVRQGKVPPVGLLDFLETLGMANCQPAELGVDGLLDLLKAGMDQAQLKPDAIDRMLDIAGDSLEIMEFAETWFEHDQEVDDLLRKCGTTGMAAKVDLIVDEILEPRRAKWAERFLWMALWAKHQKDDEGPWHEFFVSPSCGA